MINEIYLGGRLPELDNIIVHICDSLFENALWVFSAFHCSITEKVWTGLEGMPSPGTGITSSQQM